MTCDPPAPALSGRGHCDDADLSAVVCHTPLSNLGHCRRGSTLSFTVAFQILKPGLYEVPSLPLPEATSWINTFTDMRERERLSLKDQETPDLGSGFILCTQNVWIPHTCTDQSEQPLHRSFSVFSVDYTSLELTSYTIQLYHMNSSEVLFD